MIIIGISGKIHAGKDTVASFISNQFFPKQVLILGFADSLKMEVASACGVTLAVLEKNKDSFRPILQWWGTDFRRKFVSDMYWVNKLSDKISKLSDSVFAVIIPDVRFMNEATFLKDNDATLIRVERPSINVDKHVSENELTITNFPWDYTIDNDGDLLALSDSVDELLADMFKK